MVMGIVALLLSISGYTEIAIKNLSYDRASDELVVTVEHPGKCMDHKLSLKKIGSNENHYRYHLALSNPHDPCNGLVKNTARFSLSDLTQRPAEILISPNEDGSKAHSFKVPVHKKVKIVSASLRNGILEAVIVAPQTFSPSQFYSDPKETCLRTEPCPAVIRTKFPFAKNVRLSHQKIQLSLQELNRPITLSLSTINGPVTIHVP